MISSRDKNLILSGDYIPVAGHKYSLFSFRKFLESNEELREPNVLSAKEIFEKCKIKYINLDFSIVLASEPVLGAIFTAYIDREYTSVIASAALDPNQVVTKVDHGWHMLSFEGIDMDPKLYGFVQLISSLMADSKIPIFVFKFQIPAFLIPASRDMDAIDVIRRNGGTVV
ncbi:MAG: hypothetical protein IPP69_11495 [Flavobacteriales bacterium]|nr:hypothetical protein [Flavobacteriales bacterium]